MEIKYIRDCFIKYNDDELTHVLNEYVNNNWFNDVFETTVDNVLMEYHNSSRSFVKYWPSETYMILKDFNPEHKVKVYRLFKDFFGWICEHNQVIEIL